MDEHAARDLISGSQILAQERGGEKGPVEEERPVMIHRAIAGSLERFMSVIIEHFAGNFPLWLAPIQVKILPITETHGAYAGKVYSLLKEKGLRVDVNPGEGR